jgi:lipopolysaccharide export system permease protein
MFLRRTTHYILTLLLWPLALITFCLSGIVWLMQAVRFIDFIINRGLSVEDFLYLTMLLLPSLLTYILPIALLIAVIFIYHKLISESELIVMQAGGCSRWQLARPAMLAGVMVAAITYSFTLYLLPLSNREFRDMREFLKENYASVLLQEEVFNHPVEGITVFIRSRDETGKLRGLLVHDSRNRSNTITMMAEKATLVQTASGPRFMLENGIRQEMRDGSLSWLNFESYNLDLSYYTKQNLNRKREETELFTSELWRKVALMRVQGAKLDVGDIAELHRRITWPLMSIVLATFAVACLTGGQYGRRGMWKKLCATAACSLIIVVLFFGLLTMINEHLYSLLIIYGYFVMLAVLIIALFYKISIKPNMLHLHCCIAATIFVELIVKSI